MKSFFQNYCWLYLSVLLSALLVGCGGPIGQSAAEETVEKSSEPSALPPVVLATPTPIPQPTPTSNLAPPGQYFLLERASALTSTSVVAFPAGTEVREISPGIYEAQGEYIEISPDKVTNDLDKVSEMLVQQRTREIERRNAGIRAREKAQEKQREAQNQEERRSLSATMSEPTPEPMPEPISDPVPEPVQQPTLNSTAATAPLPPVNPQPLPTPEEQEKTRVFEASSGATYHIRVRGAKVSD